jgi:hypothetical protein
MLVISHFISPVVVFSFQSTSPTPLFSASPCPPSVIPPALSAVAKGAEALAYLPFPPDFGGRGLQSKDLSCLVFLALSSRESFTAPKTKNPPANSSLAVGSKTHGLDSVLAFQPPHARGRASTHAAATAAAAPAAASARLAVVLHKQKAYT